ncbi:RNA polymerase sigma factor [Membranihabitans marinus]|uniref:RNA polymerase sigma factor n=1 Tax=Membranihabitans marinus TaxID=1227546 RepID=UPI001EFF76C7|nr:RNA polymerase sigma-70 factor [Membranihabitans marinus]
MKHTTSTQSDFDLLVLLQKKDVSAMETLYAKYWEKLYLSAYKVLKNKIACEDIVQEIFIDLWQKPPQNPIHNLSAYLYQATKYKVFMVLRKNKISNEHLEIIKRLQQEQSSYDSRAAMELKDEIIQTLDQLPNKCREVFYMSRFQHIPNQEIADQMGISKRTVETHISHAIKYLRGVKELFILLLSSMF